MNNFTAYKINLEKSLVTMNDRIAQLEIKLAKMEQAEQPPLRKILDEVKSKRDIVQTKLRRTANATDAALGEMKDGIDHAWSALQKSFDHARSELEDKAPVS